MKKKRTNLDFKNLDLSHRMIGSWNMDILYNRFILKTTLKCQRYHIIMRRVLKNLIRCYVNLKKMQACTKIKNTYDQNKSFKIIKKEAFYQQGNSTATYV